MQARTDSNSGWITAIMPSRRLRISAAQRGRASSALTGDCRAAAWRRTPLFGVARCEITAGDMAGSIDRLTVRPRDPRRHCSFHRTAGIARRSCGVDLPARRVAGHCPGDETAAAVHLVDLALRFGRDRIGGINAGGPGHRRIAGRCLTRGRRLDRPGELHLRCEFPFPGLDVLGSLRRDGYGGGEGQGEHIASRGSGHCFGPPYSREANKDGCTCIPEDTKNTASYDAASAPCRLRRATGAPMVLKPLRPEFCRRATAYPKPFPLRGRRLDMVWRRQQGTRR